MSSLPVEEKRDLQFFGNASMDKRIYNKSTATEIVEILSSVDGKPPYNRHIVAHHK